MENTMRLTLGSGEETTVLVVRETEKAILVRGNCSSAWFPKSCIDSSGAVANWITLELSHQFLWIAPYKPGMTS
jgi:hypothetical protein